MRKIWIVAFTGFVMMLGASSAGAATVAGGGPYAASGGAARLVITSGAGIPINCVSSGISGTFNTGVFTPPATVGSAVMTFGACTGPSGLVMTITCNAPTAAVLRATGLPSGGTTSMAVTSIGCTLLVTATGCTATLSGSVTGSYTNPAMGANGRLKVAASGSSLTISSSQCQTILPNTTTDLGAPVGGTTGLMDLTYVLTTAGPTLT